MTLAIAWPHDPGENCRRWPHDPGDRQQATSSSGLNACVTPVAGVAPPAVDGRRPKAEAFASALDFVAAAQVRNRARSLGDRMRGENGVTNAVAILERVVRA
jgi:hypothetical protein